MTKFTTVLVSLALFSGASALAPSKVSTAKRPAFDPKRVAFNGMAAASLASALVVGPMADAVDMMADTPSFGSSSLVAERVTREGIYKEYDVDLGDQAVDDAKSTYKSAKETKGKKGMLIFYYVMFIISSSQLSRSRSIIPMNYTDSVYEILSTILSQESTLL